jgi:hypothetical protein
MRVLIIDELPVADPFPSTRQFFTPVSDAHVGPDVTFSAQGAIS